MSNHRIFYSKYPNRRTSHVVNTCLSAIRQTSVGEDIIVIAPSRERLADIFTIVSERCPLPNLVLVKRRANPYLRIIREDGTTTNLHGFAAPASQQTDGKNAKGFSPSVLIVHDVQDLNAEIFFDIVCPCAYTRPDILILATCDRYMPGHHPLNSMERWESTRVHNELHLKIVEEEVGNSSHSL